MALGGRSWHSRYSSRRPSPPVSLLSDLRRGYVGGVSPKTNEFGTSQLAAQDTSLHQVAHVKTGSMSLNGTSATSLGEPACLLSRAERSCRKHGLRSGSDPISRHRR